MDTKTRAILFLAVFLLLAPLPGASAELAVDLKNDATMTVSVPLGADNGVTPAADFEADAGDAPVLLYPDELFERRFWSQPLSPEEYERLGTGTPVRRVALDNAAHIGVRVRGRERKAAYRERWEAARREAARREGEELRRKKASLEERRDALDVRIAGAEKALADEEARLDWLTGSEDREIDRALQGIQDAADRRDELQEQRAALSGRTPPARGEMARLSAEIGRLNEGIASERAKVRASRDRKRSARTSFLGARKEWQNLVADRNALDAEIRGLDRQIRELAAGVR